MPINRNTEWIKSTRARLCLFPLNCQYVMKKKINNMEYWFVQTFQASLFSGIEADKCKGFVQDATFLPEFSMSLFSERQLKCIRQVPVSDRIVHMDASGGFVNISKKTGFVYQRMLNYVMLMKDDRMKQTNNLVIGEMVSIYSN
jgi:hypothetical protein